MFIGIVKIPTDPAALGGPLGKEVTPSAEN